MDNAEEVKKLLTSKVQKAATGDQYLYVMSPGLASLSSLPHANHGPKSTGSESARLISLDLLWKLSSPDMPT